MSLGTLGLSLPFVKHFLLMDLQQQSHEGEPTSFE